MTTLLTSLPAIIATLVAAIAGVAASIVAWRKASRSNEITVSIQKGSVRVDIVASGKLNEVQQVISDILGTVKEEDLGDVLRDTGNPEVTIVQIFGEIERAANEALDPHPGGGSKEDRRRGVFQLRKMLFDQGYWTSAQLQKFDNIAKLRNSIVHGDNKTRATIEEARRAVADANELLVALRTQPSKGSSTT